MLMWCRVQQQLQQCGIVPRIVAQTVVARQPALIAVVSQYQSTNTVSTVCNTLASLRCSRLPATAARLCHHQVSPSDKPRTGDAAEDEGRNVLYADQANTWLDRSTVIPAGVKPYMKLIRIDRPVGTWLLMWPGFWSIAMAAPAGHWPDITLLTTFGIGALVMRGAGCTINDMWDRDIDGQVARTLDRPIASGAVSPFQALVFLGAQLSVGLAILLSLNTYSIILGAASVGLVVIYPLMKRVTNWPQLVLGFAFNYGALLGWAAVHGSLHMPAVLPLYAAGIGWTIVYDTIYAHQDREDDAALGLKSTALYFGDRSKPILSAISAASIISFTAAGFGAAMSWPYFVGVGIAGAHMMWQIHTMNMHDRWNLTSRFVSNKWVGLALFAGAVAGNLVM